MNQWLEEQGKKLMVLLSYGEDRLVEVLKGSDRFDQVFIDYLERNNILYVDGLLKHTEDYKTFSPSYENYIARYYIRAAGAAVFGHYNPTGNHFFAFSIKNEIVNWLNPRPPAYR